MAAQRLIAILIALLVVSSMMAIVAGTIEDQREGDETAEETTTEDEVEPAPVSDRRTETLTIDPGAELVELEAAVGERIELTITAEEPTTISIEPLGRLEIVDRAAPARFDLILREEGELTLTSPLREEPVARIAVARESAAIEVGTPGGEERDAGAGSEAPEARETESRKAPARR